MDKWTMFKNYMHNELAITKDDIKLWVEEAVRDIARRLVDKEWSNFDVKDIIRDIVEDNNLFGGRGFKHEVFKEIADQIIKKMKVEIK